MAEAEAILTVDAEDAHLLNLLEQTLVRFEEQLAKWERERQLIYSELNARVENYRSLYLGTLVALSSALDEKDPYTRGHSSRVTAIAVAMARTLKAPRDFIEKIRIVGLLHDIGKIGIPESILNNPGKLTALEYYIMKEHPLKGVKIIQAIDGMEEVALWVKHHHERWDGQGYPDGLAGEQVPLASRIIAVADTFDAMVSNRAYRRAMTHAKALEILRDVAGSQHDPAMTQCFLDLYDRGAIHTIYESQ